MVAGRGMKRKKQKNPLRRRLLRELKSDITKYLAVFFIMILTIGLCSGYQVSGNSMVKSYYEGFEKYNIEDGHFRVRKPLNRQQAREIEALGVRLCELFYVPRSLTNGTHIRMRQNDLPCFQLFNCRINNSSAAARTNALFFRKKAIK